MTRPGHPACRGLATLMLIRESSSCSGMPSVVTNHTRMESKRSPCMRMRTATANTRPGNSRQVTGRSKLGNGKDIRHNTLSALEGTAYGTVHVVLERQRQEPAKS